MKEPVLILLKPDSLSNYLTGKVIDCFCELKLDIIAIRTTKVSKELAKEHYNHLSNQPFFSDLIDHITGEGYSRQNVIVIIYCGEGAIARCRALAGATNPQEADPQSIRGAYGKVTKEGRFENVIHISESTEEAKREIKLWFDPDDIITDLYPVKEQTITSIKKRVWL